jgi:putative transposase
VKAHQAIYPIATMCRVLGVSTSGYYAWRKRGPSPRQQADAVLQAQIQTIHSQSDGTYGAPRIREALIDQGFEVGRRRIARLLREAGLQGITRRKKVWTTQRSEEADRIPDRVDRDFMASGPDQLWVADVSYIPTWEGFLYLAVVLDVWSRRVVGWSMADHLRTELVLDALNRALMQRHPASVIHHSDHGSQYTAEAFVQRCKDTGVRLSMGSVGDCFDNALCESFFATLKCERVHRRHYRTREEAVRDLFHYIEGWYNPHRRHSALGYQSPLRYENSPRIVA